MILATPTFYPVVVKLGFDLIWFAISVGVVLMIGVVIPPVAICVFIVKNITNESILSIYKGVAPFLNFPCHCLGAAVLLSPTGAVAAIRVLRLEHSRSTCRNRKWS